MYCASAVLGFLYLVIDDRNLASVVRCGKRKCSGKRHRQGVRMKFLALDQEKVERIRGRIVGLLFRDELCRL